MREFREQLGRAALDPVTVARELLQDLFAQRERVNQTRPVEKAMGMFDVTQAEAQQIIDFVHGLNASN